MEKVFVLQKVATRLFAAENALDSALSEATALVADIIQARKDLGLSAVVGDSAIAKVAESIAELGSARSAMIAAHGQLEETKLRLGVRTKLAGYEDKTHNSAEKSPTSLRIAS